MSTSHPIIQKTVYPIHFEDFSGFEFERLVHAFLYRYQYWDRLEWSGQSGNDSGKDIWGTLHGKSHCFQCANHQKLGFSKIARDIDKLLEAKPLPDRFTVVCGGKISALLRSKIINYTVNRGIAITEVWSGAEFEERLRTHCPELIRRFLMGEDLSDTFSTADQIIPLAPHPYIAHPYAMVKNFTGRRDEMASLTNWFMDDQTPFCVVEGMGGMGKSALCWKWVKDQVIPASPKLRGIIWWCFYNQSFEEFIHHVYQYCVPAKLRRDNPMVDETTEVLNVLSNHKFLLILDGFERILKGYAQMSSMYFQEELVFNIHPADKKEPFDVYQRTPVNRKAEKLLRTLCAGASKTIITTRLFPSTIEDLSCVLAIRLSGLSEADTVLFFKSEGISGTHRDMINAGKVYGFHPLLLKLLSSTIKRSFVSDIDKAIDQAFTKGLIDRKEPQKILNQSFQLLNQHEQTVATTLSVFRSSFSFNAANAVFNKYAPEELEAIMRELCNLGFLMYNDQLYLFDLHPVLRAYLHDKLNAKEVTHQMAVDYFSALPTKDKIVTLDDQEPIIEKYYHLIEAKRLEDALDLFNEHLLVPLVYQLALYELCGSLCLQLLNKLNEFPIEDRPRVEDGYLLNIIGLCYANTGQLYRANQTIVAAMSSNLKANDKMKLAIGMNNLSGLVLIPSGKFLLATIYLRKAIRLFHLETPLGEHDSKRLISNLLIARGTDQITEGTTQEERFLIDALKYCREDEKHGLAARVTLEYTKLRLQSAYTNPDNSDFKKEAFSWAYQTIALADRFRLTDNPNLLFILCAYESISLVLLQAIRFDWQERVPGKVYFYDEYIQNILEAVIPEPNSYLAVVERIVHEGLVISRKINRIYLECTFLYLLSRIEFLKIDTKEVDPSQFKQLTDTIKDVFSLAERLSFAMMLADLHIFCAEILIDLGKSNAQPLAIMDLPVKEHLNKAHQYTKDDSTMDDLFKPMEASASDFYRDIPEYEILKRGLSDQDRLKYGYFSAWQLAESLENGYHPNDDQ